jgi:hypothetical protein
MHGPINVKSPNNISKWHMGFNSAFKGLMTARNRCRVAQYEAAFILVPLSMKSTTSTRLWSQNTIYQQISHCEFIRSRLPGKFQIHARKFCFQGVVVNRCIVSSDHVSRKSRPRLAYCWRNETLLTILRGLRSSDSARGIHHTRNLCKPNS